MLHNCIYLLMLFKMFRKGIHPNLTTKSFESFSRSPFLVQTCPFVFTAQFLLDLEEFTKMPERNKLCYRACRSILPKAALKCAKNLAHFLMSINWNLFIRIDRLSTREQLRRNPTWWTLITFLSLPLLIHLIDIVYSAG